MVPEPRRDFNARYTPGKYQDFLRLLDERCGTGVKFRNCETPCFFPRDLIDRMAQDGRELVEQLVGNHEYLAAADRAIPPEFRAPHDSPHPLFVQADFGVVRQPNGALQPKLVEIQGFPSLYAYQPVLAQVYKEAYGLDPGLNPFLDGLEGADYRDLVRQAIVGDRNPENVVLLEIDPQEQKTLPDFLLTERICGVRTVDIRDVHKRGSRLYYDRDGVRVPIHRIYNRAIADELIRKRIQPEFDFRDDLDVEWAGHPNWFFRISKFSIPWLRHPSVPQTWFLDQPRNIPEDLENYVLKPLYSFAGLGVTIGPTPADIENVPRSLRSEYILQKRLNFEPVIATPFGATKAEVRIMYIWLDKLRAVTTIIRMGRGKMMGVDQNRDLEWVGASAGFVV
ncbi:MAG: hypothetical protein M3Z23_06720 [Acidobacteriota bacterium]|nr:hypothetical protein [Acidobacteriota bacterium]